MRKDIADKWVAALRSGLYEQGHGQLRGENNHFCCLGVLCNLHAMEHPEIADEQEHPGEYIGNETYLPWPVMEWAGIHHGDGRIKRGVWVFVDGRRYLIRNLAALNDGFMSFEEIATVIEKRYKDI